MTTLYSPPHLTCPHCEGPARVVTNGLCERCREEDRLRAALAREKERADRAEARLLAAAKVSPMCAENTDLRARAERAEAALNAARFWADEFAEDDAGLMVFTLYAYVTHWHDVADRLAGGPGEALAAHPPPTSEKVRADYDSERAALAGSSGGASPAPSGTEHRDNGEGFRIPGSES